MLNEADAINLYKLKFNPVWHNQSTKGRSGIISKWLGISARAVRDIWNRKTWTFATRHLWASEDSFALGGDWTGPSMQVFSVRKIS